MTNQPQTVSIEIDGQTLVVPQGSMVIEAADSVGIKIPRFCYHKKLTVAANCRMCLVEVEKAPKPLPACATPVSPGMKVKTRSALALDAQKSVMEFLLINHPLDCPICDQGGQCELQDVAMGYGQETSRYSEDKRVVKDKNLGPLISTDMTRCIHCTRCVRFGEEIAGIREMGATGRGEFMKIGTYIEKSIDSELSGNIIDLCPVGALTSKPFRYKARAWELKETSSVASHDGLGSNIYYHVYHSEVMRVVPRENESINEVWLSDRDRYSYQGFNSEERLKTPMIKEEGVWRKAEWVEALEKAAGLIEATVSHDGAEQVGALISPSATLEELYLFQKLLRAHGVTNIDHRLRVTNTTHQEAMPAFPTLGCKIDAIKHYDRLLVVGSNVQKELPLLALRLKQAEQQGAEISVLNPCEFSTIFKVAHQESLQGGDMILSLAGILKALGADPSDKVLLEKIHPTATNTNIAKSLSSGSQKILLLGSLALHHPDFDQIYYLANHIAALTGATVGFLPEGSNAAGAWIAGVLPHRAPLGKPHHHQKSGLSSAKMLEKPLSTYVLWNIEPEFDCAHPLKAVETLKQAKHVIAVTPFVTEQMKEYASVLLPLSVQPETAGTFVNLEGTWQHFDSATPPLAESRPGWKILRVLGNVSSLEGFEYQSISDVREEIAAGYADFDPSNGMLKGEAHLPDKLTLYQPKGEVVLVSPTAIYRTDNVVRRASALQATKDAEEVRYARVHPEEAARMGAKEGDIFNGRPVKLDTTVPVGVVLAYAGVNV